MDIISTAVNQINHNDQQRGMHMRKFTRSQDCKNQE